MEALTGLGGMRERNNHCLSEIAFIESITPDGIIEKELSL
jgi:hypothetical protein